jgi:alkylation response protein AidB-like acyl-CoA dehydrogenase
VNLDFTDEQEELRGSVRAVLARECSVGAVRALVEARVRGEDTGDDALDRRLWRTTAGLDWPALTVPEAHGGLGLGAVELAVLAEELGRSLAPGPTVTTPTALLPALRACGDAARMGAVARGELTGTLAVAEAGSWDLDAVRATAARRTGGWRLDGRKDHVVEVGGVDEHAAVLRTDDGGWAIALVPAGCAPVAAVRPLDPTRRLGSLVLDGVELDDDRVHVVDEAALRRVLDEATLAVALDAVGCCHSILDTNLAYAGDRVQFGVPIGSFQAVKHKLVNMFVALERARATAYVAVACAAEDDPRGSLAIATAKAAAGDCARLVASDGIQLLGGIGYTWEHDQHLFVRRAKADDVLFGDAAHHRARIAAALGLR